MEPWTPSFARMPRLGAACLSGLLWLGAACDEGPGAAGLLDSGTRNDPVADASAGADGGGADAEVAQVVVGSPLDPEALRQLCVDTINGYRDSRGLPALKRASAAQERCSDQGAELDAKADVFHWTAGIDNPCNETGDWDAFPYFGPQNTCTSDMSVDHETVSDALGRCLQQMWNEGEPPGDRQQCIDDHFAGDSACYFAHGDYLNMTGDFEGVSCGFFKRADGTYWMNQDFY